MVDIARQSLFHSQREKSQEFMRSKACKGLDPIVISLILIQTEFLGDLMEILPVHTFFSSRITTRI
jgi:hypothetical protein